MSSISTERQLSSTVSEQASLYCRAVLRALEPMRHGRLTLHLPDGNILKMGDGSNPRQARFGLDASIVVRSEEFFRRTFFHGDIGFAESYMAGEWETRSISEVISWLILNAENSPAQSASRRRALGWLSWIDKLTHRGRENNERNSRRNIAAHYDLSNDFFALFLDPSMTYSSALFSSADQSLEDAQEAKYERLAQILEIRPDDRVLEIGGGWGAFSRFLATKFGCHVTTVTISEQQFYWAARKRRDHSLEAKIDLRLQDYRRITGTFDKIVSVEMLEAVGSRYYDTFFSKCDELLAPNGLVALQVITCPESRYEAMREGVDFIQKHIFPGGEIPSTGALLESIHRSTGFTLRDHFDFGDSYARTLQHWTERFERSLPAVRALGFDENFIRKWRYYLAYCEAGFKMRHISVVQMLLTRPDNHSLRSKLL